MTVAVIDGDIVVATIDVAGADGVPVPPELSALPISALRFDGARVLDARRLNLFFVDAAGVKHVVDGAGRQPVSCQLHDELIVDGGGWRVRTASEVVAPRIGAECDRRIAAALAGKSDSMQREATHLLRLHATGAPLTAEQQADAALLSDINAWETEMIAVREALILAADPTYRDDTHWPPPPSGLTAEWLSGY